jgi:peptidyl-prolyl cis-trans isomerase D
MISWIQRTFQHHFRLIFAVLLIGMVIPFIFTIGSTPGVGRAERTTVSREFFGHNLLSQEQNRELMEDTRLSAELQYGTTNVSQEQLQYYMYQRVASLHLADQLHLPPPTTAEITEFIKRLRIFMGPDGKFDVTRYDAFRSSLKSGSGVTEADIARVISDDARINKVGHLIAGPGYVMPSDVKELLAKGDTQWTVSTATVDYASFAPEVRISDAEAAKFLADNPYRYTIPPKVSVDYVAFPASNYTAGIAPTAADVKDFYDSNPGRFPKPAPAKGAPAVKADAAADYAAVEPAVRAKLIDEIAKRAAVKAASDLAYSLYDGKVTRANVDAFLAAHGLKVESMAPFSAEDTPPEFGDSKEIASAAFDLNADRYYSEGLPDPTGAVVLIWKDSIPARQPTLAEVRDKVVADAADNQKRIRFAEFGRALKSGIERRIKSGESFDKAVAESAGSVKVEVKSYPPFMLRTRPKDVDPAVFQALDGLDKGGVSNMEASSDKGVLVYAADKKAPEVDESNPRYTQIESQLAQSFAAADETSLTREVVDDELKRTDPNPK